MLASRNKMTVIKIKRFKFETHKNDFHVKFATLDWDEKL